MIYNKETLIDSNKIENIISDKIIEAAIEVHRTLGPGLLESIYEHALIHELKVRNLSVKSQVQIPVIYKGILLKDPMRLDLLVEGKVILEIKSTEKESPYNKAQIMTYLKLSGIKLGLLLNFAHGRLIDGLIRIVNGL
jgi:GxxExxY protein